VVITRRRWEVCASIALVGALAAAGYWGFQRWKQNEELARLLTPPPAQGAAGVHIDMGAATALVRRGASVNTRGRTGLTVLMYAASIREPDLVKYLLERGAHVNARDEAGMTALTSAAWCADAPTVRLLLEHGADPNIPNTLTGWTPMHYLVRPYSRVAASARSTVPALEALLAHGADPDVRDLDGNTAAVYARRSSQIEVLRVIEASKRRRPGARLPP
jgi:ankyrin repeat protein